MLVERIEVLTNGTREENGFLGDISDSGAKVVNANGGDVDAVDQDPPFSGVNKTEKS